MFCVRLVSLVALVGASFVVRPVQGQEADGSGAAAVEGAGQSQGDDSSARERAKALYEEGLSAYRAGRYSDAVDKLLEADQVMPNAAFSYNIALVYEKMGDQRSALRWLRSYLRQSNKQGTDDPAVAKVRKLEAELQAQGMQQVTVLSKPAGATVELDGRALGVTPFTTEVTPGTHRVGLALQGYDSTQKYFELRPDRSLDVQVVLQVTKAPDAATAPPARSSVQTAPEAERSPAVAAATDKRVVAPIPPPAPVTEARSPRVRPWTWIGLGVGTALLGASAVFELERRKSEDEARSASQRDYQTRYDEMHNWQTVARVFTAAGTVAMATGLTLLTVDLARSGPRKQATLGNCESLGICAEMRGQF